MRSLFVALCALGVTVLAFALSERSVRAWQPCDFVTGGGFVYVNGAKATFGVAGGCKDGSGTGTPPQPYWGHLEYQDKGTGLDVHWTKITAYDEWWSGTDDRGKPSGRRLVCGVARTNDPAHPTVNFAVVLTDNGEPGVNDEFAIDVTDPGATYPYYFVNSSKLGGGTGGGGNIQIQKPNNSTTGVFGGDCPALPH
jgi:hypothetical protein